MKRWGDDLASYAGGDWAKEAANDGLWQAALSGYVDADGLVWRGRAYSVAI